jgi:hypothetical protein
MANMMKKKIKTKIVLTRRGKALINDATMILRPSNLEIVFRGLSTLKDLSTDKLIPPPASTNDKYPLNTIVPSSLFQ